MFESHEDMVRIIYDRVLPEMEANGIPDTTENRIPALEGLRDAWIELGEPKANPWIIALNRELLHLHVTHLGERWKIR